MDYWLSAVAAEPSYIPLKGLSSQHGRIEQLSKVVIQWFEL
jgi:hypothetical protein